MYFICKNILFFNIYNSYISIVIFGTIEKEYIYIYITCYSNYFNNNTNYIILYLTRTVYPQIIYM